MVEVGRWKAAPSSASVASGCLRILQADRQAAVFLPEPLAFDQQGQPAFEAQRNEVVLLALFFEGLDQARQAQGAEFFERWVQQHKVGGGAV